jgi:hypothetical protein
MFGCKFGLWAFFGIYVFLLDCTPDKYGGNILFGAVKCGVENLELTFQLTVLDLEKVYERAVKR